MARMKTKEVQAELVATMRSWQHIEDAAVTATNTYEAPRCQPGKPSPRDL